MGKKRRILTRTTKFAKKYFGFLDKIDASSNVIDAAEIDDRIEIGDPFVDTIVITDLDNQTVKFEGRVLGFADDDKVEFSFDGGTFANETAIDADAGAQRSGLDELQFLLNPFNNGSFLTPGQHTISVRKKGENNTALHKTETFEVAPARIEMTAKAGFLTAVPANGQINIDLREITYGARRRPGETTNYQVGAQGGANTGGSYIMSATKQVGATLEAAQAAEAVAIAFNGGLEDNNEDHNIADVDAIIDAGDLPAAEQFVVYTFTVTPRHADNTTVMTSEAMVATINFQLDA